jgi:hypothetical protein
MNFLVQPLTPLDKSGYYNVLTLRGYPGNEVTVNGKLTTQTFRMTTSPGLNKVLTSDALGNATWANVPSTNDMDWLEAGNSGGDPTAPQGNGIVPADSYNLYVNPKYTNVGIGTTKPVQQLHVQGGNILISPNALEAPGSRNGSLLFSDGVSARNTLGEWGIEYYSNNMDYESNGLNFWKPYSSGSGGANNILFLRNDGNIGIGTQQTHNYKLAVNGKILCTELKVQLEKEWGDYVFDKSYKLRPLHEVEKYITENKHLPEVPSAEEVKANGLNMGEMNTLLMKKVEELTLYIISQQKQIDELKSVLQSK